MNAKSSYMESETVTRVACSLSNGSFTEGVVR